MASNDQTVAPKERVNIVYKPHNGGAKEESELPLKILVVGDYTGRPDATPLGERKPINVDKNNFDEVMESQKLAVAIQVDDKLSEEAGATLNLQLKFKSLADFTPEGLAQQVPELKQLLELRAALSSLKSPLGDAPAFRKKIQALLSDEEGRKKLISEVGLKEG